MPGQTSLKDGASVGQDLLKPYALSYLEARRSDYSWFYFVRRFAVWYVLGAVIAAVSFVLLWWLDAAHEYHVFIAGVMVGCVLRDFAWFLSMRAAWRAVTVNFIDWNKVEALAGGAAAPDAASR